MANTKRSVDTILLAEIADCKHGGDLAFVETDTSLAQAAKTLQEKNILSVRFRCFLLRSSFLLLLNLLQTNLLHAFLTLSFRTYVLYPFPFKVPIWDKVKETYVGLFDTLELVCNSFALPIIYLLINRAHISRV